MVLAEIPLWLVHESSSGGPNGVLGGRPDSVSGILNQDSDSNVERAQDSLSLLESSGRGKKCAIYSVDVDPSGTKFATSGGDGMVRLWSTSALFSRKRSRYGEGGTYESSEVSFSDSSGNENGDDRSSRSHKRGRSHSGKGNDRHSPVANSTEKAVQPGTVQEELVHDLNDLVRRKKGGEIRSPTKFLDSSREHPANNMSPSRTNMKPQNHNRLLCTLAAHTGSSVLAVRFSTNGQYLASAGDDAVVCVYAPSSVAKGNLTDTNSSEHWARIKLCRGHALDVVGLAWAPDDSHLVSCSLDSDTPIIVWKLTDLASSDSKRRKTHSNVLCNPYKILGKGIHTSTVKGVTFDPAGTYLASSGDDPAVCIWRAYDDWGLERRVDATSGIFRRWKEDDTQSLSCQTLFRRLSWSTDGAFICSTNCVVKNRHVASTISREGWNVSSANCVAAGAANLVGHKQPVMVSRHSFQLLDSRKQSKRSDIDGEPEYATLLALGDRHGFVTIWSTRKARPIFKLQCSESRCTVTDLAWGKLKKHIVLLVSLLDGHVVALRFAVPGEVGPLLDEKEKARVFQLRYGIDPDDASDLGRRRLFVGENSGPNLIENALQLSLEDRRQEDKKDDNQDDPQSMKRNSSPMHLSTPSAVKLQQKESRSQGKKRIRPVLMGAGDDVSLQPPTKKPAKGSNGEKVNGDKKKQDPLQYAVDVANKASSALEAVLPGRSGQIGDRSVVDEDILINAPQTDRTVQMHTGASMTGAASLPHSTKRIHSVDLPVVGQESVIDTEIQGIVADCSNSVKVPTGSQGSAISCTDVSISRGGRICWRDQIPGTTCSALAASRTLLAVGTSDGCVQLYGTSPSLGWTSGTAFRSHPPFIFGHSVVALQLHERKGDGAVSPFGELDMLILTSDGTFGVYSVLSELRLRYKGSVLPAMMHMNLGFASTDRQLPKVSRIQITESDRLFLLLSSANSSNLVGTSNGYGSRNPSRQVSAGSRCAGGSLQAFVYNLSMELWMRISDGRFALSEFYSTLPSTSKLSSSYSQQNLLSQFDDAVRMGAIESSLVSGRGSRGGMVQQLDVHADHMYQQAAEGDTGGGIGNFTATRSHCEDRMACSLALGSTSEFTHWLSLYVRILAQGGHAALLRVLVDLLLGANTETKQTDEQQEQCQEKTNDAYCCWWLSSAPTVLNLDRKSIIETIVIPEMSKNRGLQRVTNEVALEMDNLKSPSL